MNRLDLVAGPSGAGKSTFVERWRRCLGAVCLSTPTRSLSHSGSRLPGTGPAHWTRTMSATRRQSRIELLDGISVGAGRQEATGCSHVVEPADDAIDADPCVQPQAQMSRCFPF